MTLRRDAERIQEELEGADRIGRPRSLASDYLHQAAETFHAAGDPGALYRQWMPNPTTIPQAQPFMHSWAREERFKQARTCVLLAAFAAEAYVNEFLAAFDVPSTRLRELDRLSTVRKYTKGTADAYGHTLFSAGDEVIPQFERLFELRHRLAHPKPGFGSGGLLAPPDVELERKFALTKLAEFVIAVAGAADILMRRAYGFDFIDSPSSAIWLARAALREFAVRRTTLPAPGEAPEPSIWNVLGDYLEAQPRFGHSDQFAVGQIRNAKRAARLSPPSRAMDE